MPGLLLLGNVYLADEKVFAGEDGLFKAAAVRAVALVFYDVEYLVALVALRHSGDDIQHELRGDKYPPHTSE